jgi:hypothetical protein
MYILKEWAYVQTSNGMNIKIRSGNDDQPVTVAEQSKACTVFARSEAGIVSSNPTQGINV